MSCKCVEEKESRIIYRELLEKYVDVHFYNNQYFVYAKGRSIPGGNQPGDFNMFPIEELYMKVDEDGYIMNTNIKPYSYWVIENCKK